ncbi:MAG: GMP reductase [Gammaproteobacteria bacterium]|nr:GMP reductase [Gammaproteobacteria bacterium]
MLESICTEIMKLDFDDVLIEPRRAFTSLTRKSVDITIPWLDFHAYPIVIANMPSTGTYQIAKHMTPMKVFTFIHKEYTALEHVRNLGDIATHQYIAITSGVQEWDIEKTDEVLTKFPNIGMINIDIANVYANMFGMVNTIKHYREKFPDTMICAGNVCDTSLMKELVRAGANYIKVGVGSGAACITRTEVGVGVPQFSAVQECCEEAEKIGCKIISDGGCVTSGDVCKAIAAGAEMVMIAGMVSNTYECDNKVTIEGKQYVNLYGLGSNKMYDRTSPTEQEYRPNEGRDLLVPTECHIEDVINQILGGLRSVCTYVGVRNLTQLSDHATFIRVSKTHNRSLERYG